MKGKSSGLAVEADERFSEYAREPQTGNLTVNQREPSLTACGARRKEGEDAPQHSELSCDSDDNEVMLQAGHWFDK